ncbi:MAG: hypothetical protein AAFW69_12075 [Pseudomonadota bacterium]
MPIIALATVIGLVALWFYARPAFWVALLPVAAVVSYALWIAFFESAREADVALTIALDREACTAEAPLSVTIENGANRTLDRTIFTLSATRPGFSGDLFAQTRVESRKIIAPGESYTECYPLPRQAATVADLDALAWRGSVTSTLWE